MPADHPRIGRQSPYIFIMGSPTGRQDVAESLESGASEYLSMPFEEQELKARLIVALRALTARTT